MNFSALARSVSQRFKSGGGKKKLVQSPKKASSPSPSSSSSSSSSSNESHPSLTNCSTVVPCSIALTCSDNEEENEADQLATAADQLMQRRQPYQQIIEQILHQVSELEHTLYEDQQEEFKLRLTLERQTERINELNFSLDAEKQRNNRLIQLLRNGGDNCSLTDDHGLAEDPFAGGSPVKSSGELYESISPLLMQQRYDELAASHRQSRRQLAKKEQAFKNLQCETEELRAKYNELFDEFRKSQRRTEIVCSRYLQMSLKKKQKICMLRNTLSSACQCLYHAQEIINSYGRNHMRNGSKYTEHKQKYNQNFECFLIALRHCCSQRKLQELQLREKPKQQSNPIKPASSMISSDATLLCPTPTPKSELLKSKAQSKNQQTAVQKSKCK